MAYEVDLRDLEFQLFDWLGLDGLLAHSRFEDWDRESLEMVLREAAELARNELAPINAQGDREGVRWHDGEVQVPESVHGAWKLFQEGGWVGTTSSAELGGLGLPDTVGTALNEIFSGANLSFCLVTLLTRGAADLIADHGGSLRERYCEKMITGEWTGTMCLTEPHAGSDVGASTTRAVPQDDGTYLLEGEKIFITSGEHDLTENIVHAVLARTPDAPAGTRGLSLFAVPKIWVEDDGTLAGENDVYCAGVEHKMGIHASPTCTLLFGRRGRCRGHLLGEEGQGMALMFEMMNAARIEVGVQGAAVASAAFEAARAYAHEREQMRHWNRASGPKGRVAIVEHPDVRRMLMASTSYVQAMRALLLRTSYYLDLSHTHAENGEHYAALVALLTPVCKAWPSDWGFRVTEWAVQVYGGYGYTEDYPVAQYLRDQKITSIYEGTNGIQALDFVGRKLSIAGGAPLRTLLSEVSETTTRLADDPALGAAARQVARALETIETLLATVPGRPDGALQLMLDAVPVVDAFGALLGGTFLLQQAERAGTELASIVEQKALDPADDGARAALLAEGGRATFLHNKVQAALFFCHRAVPPAAAQLAAMEAGEQSAMAAIL